MEKVAAVATDEPEIAAKPPHAATVAKPSPPRIWPTKVFAARNSSRLTPDVDTKAHRGTERVLAVLEDGPLTAPEIAAAGQLTRSAVKDATRHLRESGNIELDPAST